MNMYLVVDFLFVFFGFFGYNDDDDDDDDDDSNNCFHLKKRRFIVLTHYKKYIQASINNVFNVQHI